MGTGADPGARGRRRRDDPRQARERLAGARRRADRPDLSAPAERLVEELAPAKINLDLHVLGRRSDGFHALDSLVVFADLADRLSAAPADDLDLSVSGPEAQGVPADESNLVVRATRLLATASDRRPAVRLRLEKHLPAAAGIGGGSTDAAAALRALARLWGLGLAQADLEALGRKLGADVPVCVGQRTVVMRGIGECLEPVRLARPLHLLLVNPRIEVPTGSVFRELRAPPVDPHRRSAGGSPEERLRTGRNDLEAPATRIAPAIGEVLERLRALPGAQLARMSGSGATCFGWFEGPELAAAAESILRHDQPGWWVRASVAGIDR